MTDTPRAFATLDLGGATTAVALVALVAGQWRLLGSLAGPSGIAPDRLLELLAERVCLADPALAEEVDLQPAGATVLPRLTARTPTFGTLAVLAASERVLGSLGGVAARSGWCWRGGSVERQGAQALAALVLDPDVSVVVVGAGDPPGGDERGALATLGALTAAAAQRRPELTVVLAGAMTHARTRFGLPPERPSRLTRGEGGGKRQPGAGDHGADMGWLPEGWELVGEPDPPAPRARVVIAPRPSPGSAAWAGLTDLLAGLRRDPSDSRAGIAAAATGLAGALDRRVEVIEIGFDGGLRATGLPGRAAGAGAGFAVASADAALLPPGIDEGTLDRVQGWDSLPLDRHRLRDRLIELRAAPWSAASGDGARLRLAAARAAMARLVELTPEIEGGPPPDVLVVAGGVFAPIPPAATVLAVADVVRRPVAIQVVLDHARLLGPLGTIEDPVERDRLLSDLAGDLLLPLGAIVMPAGLRKGRAGGQVTVDAPDGAASFPLERGRLERVRLPAGQQALVTIAAGETVQLGARGRRILVEVAGGVAGLLVDLRDIPLHLPDRREARRELLQRWQDAAWPEGVV